jgi:glycosyltransferase involved in cell wall biosynthesis
MNLDVENLKNVKFIGYISDSDFVLLLKECKAFLFPSFYEGFGIPPLEAMCVGAPVVVSDIPVLKEIFGLSADYVDPYVAEVDINAVLKEGVANSSDVLNKFSWEKSARIIKECCRI